MHIHRFCIVVGALLVIALGSACSFTTANISGLKLSKDKEGTNETNSFAPGDPIYARATVSNVPSKVTLKFRLFTENVEGQQQNAPVSQFDTSIEMPRSGIGTYSLTPPPRGWPVGKYRIEVAMLIESGEQKDHKAVTFTVAR